VGFDPARYPSLKDDVEFAKSLLAEELVFTLPATIFKCPNFVRLVITPPIDKLEEACSRIEAFCARHLGK
jgi:tyrosine aminotransferase